MIEELNKTRDILSKIEYSDLVSILNSYLPKIACCILDIENKPFAFNQIDAGGHNLIYRARINSPDPNTPYSHVKDISYVPKEDLHKVKSYGRINKPGEAMFYGATNIGTACFETFTKGSNLELLKKEGSIMLTLGTWVLVENLTLAQIIHSRKYFKEVRDQLPDLNPKGVSESYVDKLNNSVKLDLGNDLDYQILEFFSDEFAKINTHDHNEYKLSNYYADRILNRIKGLELEEEIDGIYYPSVASGYNDYNLALPPDKVKKLEFVNASHIWVTWNPNDKVVRLIPIKNNRSADKDGKIRW